MLVIPCCDFCFLWIYDNRFAWSAFVSRISRVHPCAWRLCSSARVVSSRYVSAYARFKHCEPPCNSYRGAGHPIHSILSNSLLCPRLIYFAMALLGHQEGCVTSPDSLTIIPRLGDSGSSIATSLAAIPSVADLPEQYRNTTEAAWAVWANDWMHLALSRQAMFVYVCICV